MIVTVHPTFRKLTRNLSPTGKTFQSLELRSTSVTSPPVVLTPEYRTSINRITRGITPPLGAETETETTLSGRLRAVHLDEDWVEITVDGKPHRDAFPNACSCCTGGECTVQRGEGVEWPRRASVEGARNQHLVAVVGYFTVSLRS